MNRNQLKYFVATAESRSFTKAAEQFYISQTAITQQIRLLEEALGCPLFDRSTRPVSLTPAQPGRPAVGWDVGRFERLIYDQGYDAYIDRAMRCPCVDKTSGQASSTCQNCYGRGWFFVNRRETRLIAQTMGNRR